VPDRRAYPSLNLTVSQVRTSDIEVVVRNDSKTTRIAPVLSGQDNSITTQLGIYLQSVYGAKAYHVRYCAGTGPWLEAGIRPNTKGIVITKHTPGTVYSVRVRSAGLSTQYGPWSATTSLMAT